MQTLLSLGSSQSPKRTGVDGCGAAPLPHTHASFSIPKEAGLSGRTEVDWG